MARSTRRGLRLLVPLCLLVLLVGACRGRECPTCGTLVVAAIGEPPQLLPPLVQETVGRDISDQIYQKLAELEPGRPTIDPSAFRPGLARSWERVDSLTWRFHLQPDARWQDGQPVTAHDVLFSFQAFEDSTFEAAPVLAREIASITATDSATVEVRFRRFYPEQLYDATWYVRVLPAHIWDTIPSTRWERDTTLAHFVGSGPYRLISWKRGASLTLEAAARGRGAPAVRRLVWRFAEDPEAGINLLLGHEADLMEAVGLQGATRLASDSGFRLVPYPSAVYGYLGFHIAGRTERNRDPVLGDVRVRRALVEALDRETMAHSIFGAETKVPPGPMSQLLWLWSVNPRPLPYDTLAADSLLTRAGWRRGADGQRRRAGRPLRIGILVPSTSPTRRQMAEAIQQAWRARGVSAEITAVDMPVFMQRLVAGRFDAFIGAWLDEPSPRGLADQWTRSGWSALNYGHYADPVFDSLFERAVGRTNPDQARAAWRAALDTLNQDAPAAFLYALTNVAAISKRVTDVVIDPYSWLSRVREWKLE